MSNLESRLLTAERLRIMRKAHNISRAELCIKMSLVPTTVRCWEQGTRLIGLGSLKTIASHLGNCWVLYIMGLTEEQPLVVEEFVSNSYRAIYQSIGTLFHE